MAKVQINWENGFNGILKAPNGDFAVGGKKGQLAPYNMLFGALGACFYATFLDIVEKKRLTLKGATLVIDGTHREEIPFTLNYVTINMTIKAKGDEEKFLRSVELAKKYCSIYTTVSQVAEITVNVTFDEN